MTYYVTHAIILNTFAKKVKEGIFILDQINHHVKSDKTVILKKSGRQTLFKAILRKLDFSRELFSRSIDSYSQDQKKTKIAKNLSEQARLYICGGPLNYIDELSRLQMEELLKASNATLMFTKHDKRFCEQVVTKKLCI